MPIQIFEVLASGVDDAAAASDLAARKAQLEARFGCPLTVWPYDPKGSGETPSVARPSRWTDRGLVFRREYYSGNIGNV